MTVNVIIPVPTDEVREGNRLLATADRQAVFRNDCASCHAAPTKGLKGGELFVAACVICHGSDRRASTVPDLHVAKEKRDTAFWLKWIREGKEGTLMPAFSSKRGGPLSDEQMATLAEYLAKNLPTGP